MQPEPRQVGGPGRSATGSVRNRSSFTASGLATSFMEHATCTPTQHPDPIPMPPTLELPLFVDAHCHMFTAADIPLHEPARRAIGDLHPIGRVLFPALGGALAAGLLRRYEPFIRFFESEPEANTLRVEAELDLALEQAVPGRPIRARLTIATPLVMDFDLSGFDRSGVRIENKLSGQVERLVEAAAHTQRLLVLPFLGVDPRKHVYDGEGLRDRSGVRRQFGKLLREFKVKPAAERAAPGDLGDPGDLEAGDIIGIKMYPPLGFSPLPGGADAGEARERHLDLYEAIADRKLPLTVHCQEASFALVGKRDLLAFTQPDNWTRVLDGLAERGKRLRLNFGHFGGDAGIGKLVDDDWGGGSLQKRHLRSRSWTLRIARALCKYPTAWSDISAIDFRTQGRASKRHASLFLWLLALDRAEQLAPGPYRLIDKLLWGSDYPMPLAESPTYRDLLTNFVQAYTTLPGRTHWAPRPEALPPLDEVLTKLCCDNPRAFLFGTRAPVA